MRQADIIVADIGSTLTKLSAFSGMADGWDPSRFLGQGMAISTADVGTVLQGLTAARRDLENRFDVDTSRAALMAVSSAAGGLRMTVHGLTRDMTLRAASEASLGAGAIVVFTSAGRLGNDDLEEIRRLKPNLILLAGGVDFGDREVVVNNAHALTRLGCTIPVIYAGNKAARGEVRRILQGTNMQSFFAENVYPRIDQLNIGPVRTLIQEVFAEHIVNAPGMAQLKAMVTGKVIPTPAAVMQATELLAEVLGDVLTVDVGGATTDVHSVTNGSPQHAKLSIAPEPRCKRTVEGDLGVYRNAAQLIAASADAAPDMQALMAVPDNAAARQLAVELTRRAVDIAIWRHAGEVRLSYGSQGRNEVVEGRDLTAIKYVIGTGGALVRLGLGKQILGKLKPDPSKHKLLPPQHAQVLLDKHYIMAAVGVLRQHYPEQARQLLLQSIGFDCQE